jgi:hypothetical protein
MGTATADQIVRKPLAVREPSSRSLDERLALRFPGVAAAYARLIGRLPPRSRRRRSIAAIWTRFNWAATPTANSTRRASSSRRGSWSPAIAVPRATAGTCRTGPMFGALISVWIKWN